MTAELEPVELHLTGPADQLANVLRSAHARGHLVHYGKPELLPDGQYAITVTLLQPVKEQRGRRRIAQGAVILGGLALVGGAGWGLYLLVQWLTAHWLTILAPVALILVVAGLVAGRRTSHCRGCGHW